MSEVDAASGAGEGGATEGRRRTGYREKLEVYAERYGKGVRTVKRWVALGREAGDPPPLDDAEGMLEWWGRRMSQKAPLSLEEAAAGSLLDQATAPAAPARASSEVELEVGTEATLRRVQEAERLLYAQLESPGGAERWAKVVARLTPAVKAFREEAERMRGLIPRAEAERALHEVHVPIERAMRTMDRELCKVLGVPWTERIGKAWNEECDRVFRVLTEGVLR